MKIQSLLTTLIVGLSAPALAQDSDGDQVPDASDVFPCDASKAGVIYAPGQNQRAMLLFEDQWPLLGDADFNDLVVTYHYALTVDGQGLVTGLTATYDVLAIGGDYHNGLGLHLPVSAAGATVTRTIGGVSQALVPSAADAELTVTLSNDLRELFGGQTGPINSVPGSSAGSGQIVVDVQFGAPVAQTIALEAPFDLFIARSNNSAHQIHRTPYAGTANMDTALFNTHSDQSQPGLHFVDGRGLPFVLNLPVLTVWPQEGVDIALLFPDIIGFATSGGTANQDFYVSTVNGGSAFSPTITPAVLPTLGSPDLSCLCDAASLASSLGTGAYWPLDEASGPTAFDRSGAGHDGTYVGTVQFAQPGANGPAAHFGGTGHVDTQASMDILLGSDVHGTISALVKTPSTYGDASGRPATLLDCPWGTTNWYQGLCSGTRDGVSGLVFYNHYNGSAYDAIVAPVAPDTWVLATWVFDNGQLIAYVDGVEVGRGPTNRVMAGQSNRFQMGTKSGTSGRFSSTMQHVMVIPRALAAGEVQQLAGSLTSNCNNNGVANPPPPANTWPIAVGGQFVELSSNGTYACVLDAAGAVQCWGGQSEYGLISPPFTSGGYSKLTTGNYMACMLDASGRPDCWGWDRYGEITNRPTYGGFTELAVGSHHACGIVGGQLDCWGHSTRVGTVPTTSGTWMKVAANVYGSCAIDDVGQMTCFGWARNPINNAPTTGQYMDVSMDVDHGCALDLQGFVHCWGTDSADGRVSGAPTTGGFVSISAGRAHTCALDAAGAATCWGADVEGRISNAEAVTAYGVISASTNHTCGLTANGTLGCFGNYLQPTFYDLPGGNGVDADGDGLDDAMELTFGSDPNLADTDGDGWQDGAEVLNGTDPVVPN